jgi:hypothetical protein
VRYEARYERLYVYSIYGGDLGGVLAGDLGGELWGDLGVIWGCLGEMLG